MDLNSKRALSALSPQASAFERLWRKQKDYSFAMLLPCGEIMEVGHKVKMVDITEKKDVVRIAVAEGFIRLKKETIEAIQRNVVPKGDVTSTATIAAILAVKRTPELIPMCHPIPITDVKVSFSTLENGIRARCEVKSIGKTGVEMEALVGVSTALLVIWDMVKGLEKDVEGQYPETRITDIKVLKKVKASI